MANKTMATYYLPGSFMAEDYAKELPARTVDAALAVAPSNAFAFEFFDSPICDFEFDAGCFKVVPIPRNKSGRYYIGGEIFTPSELRALAVVEGDKDKYRILIANCENGIGDGTAIRCRTGNWQPFTPNDTLVPAPSPGTADGGGGDDA